MAGLSQPGVSKVIEKTSETEIYSGCCILLTPVGPNKRVRGRGIDLRVNQRFRAGDEYTAEDEPTLRLSFRQTRRL